MNTKSTNSYSIEDLEDLVKSLSGAEKRHISLLSKTFKSSANDTRFFKLYQQLLNAEFKHSEEVKQAGLSTFKTRLFENIMRSLRLFYHQKSIEVRIHGYLSDIEILYRLRLPQQSYYILNKAYQDVIAYEMFAVWLQLLMWEKKLTILVNKPKRDIEAIAAEEQVVLKRINQLIDLETIFGRMKSMKHQYGQIKHSGQEKLRAELDQLAQTISYDQCSGNKARFYYNFTHVLFHWITSNPEAAYQYSHALVSSNLEKILPAEYIDGVLEHSTSCIQLGKFAEALRVLAFADKVFHKHKAILGTQLNTKLFFYTLGYKLVIFTYMGDKQQLQQTIDHLQSELRYHEPHIPLEARQVLNANLMNAYLGVGNFVKVNELWALLFNKNSKSVRKNIYDTLRLFKLFILLQEQMHDIIPSFALSAFRYYNQQLDIEEYTLEIRLCKLFTKEYNWNSLPVRKSVYAAAKDILDDYSSRKCLFEHYYMYVIWLNSIEQNILFHEAATAWYLQYTPPSPALPGK